MQGKTSLIGMNLAKLQEIVLEEGLPAFTASQIARWIYVKHCRSIDRMSNLSKLARERLGSKYEVGVPSPLTVHTSADGTKKYLFATHTDMAVEAVMIPDGERSTLCVSSQAGCRMGCRFCMTGRQGFHGNLSTAQIIGQFLGIDEHEQLTNTVFMGMGEPMDNLEAVLGALEILTAPWGFAWSPKRITVSSIGVIPKLKVLLDSTKVHIAISLHNPFPSQRMELMPMEKAWPIEKVIALLKKYDFTGQRRVSFEYTVFSGVNDSKTHADALIRLLKGLECRVNLIRFHAIPDSPLKTSPLSAMEMFRNRLSSGGITATIRASRGEDIFAACGLLSGEHRKNSNNGEL